jgi:hypothetical protein
VDQPPSEEGCASNDRNVTGVRVGAIQPVLASDPANGTPDSLSNCAIRDDVVSRQSSEESGATVDKRHCKGGGGDLAATAGRLAVVKEIRRLHGRKEVCKGGALDTGMESGSSDSDNTDQED